MSKYSIEDIHESYQFLFDLLVLHQAELDLKLLSNSMTP